MSPAHQPEKPEEPAHEAQPDESADDVRAKFREALARKQGKEKGVPHHPDQAGSAAHTQSAKTQRMFRRKSG